MQSTAFLNLIHLECLALITAGQLILLVRHQGCWDLPGGRARYNEPLAQTVVRELHSKLGVFVLPHRVLSVSEIINRDAKHHRVSIVFATEIMSGKPSLGNASELLDWGWFSRSTLPEPVAASVIRAYDRDYCL